LRCEATHLSAPHQRGEMLEEKLEKPQAEF
jgi:hypothetical protein